MIRIEDLSLAPGGARHPSLVNINLHIERGQLVWLLGPTGAGKSSLLRLLHKAERPTSGRLFIAGRDLSTVQRRALPALRRNVALVDSSARLLPDRTLLGNVALPLVLAGEDAEIAERKARAALMDVGLGHKGRAMASEVSQGERLLCALGRALVAGPSVLLADEPTAGLDPALKADFERLIWQASVRGVTVLWATCEPSLVHETPHRVVRLERGQIVEDRPAARLAQVGGFGIERAGGVEGAALG